MTINNTYELFDNTCDNHNNIYDPIPATITTPTDKYNA